MLAPVRKSEIDPERSGARHIETDSNIAVPRILGFLIQNNARISDREFASPSTVQIDPGSVSLGTNLLTAARQQAGDVRGTAGTSEPVLPVMFPDAGERVHIEVLISSQ